MKITEYHAHLYYKEEQLEEAQKLTEKIKDKFGFEVGKLHQRPVGPHLEWSCAVSVPPEKFGEVIPWLSFNRGTIDFFIHPVTGNDLLDHTERVMWLGRSYPLNLRLWA